VRIEDFRDETTDEGRRLLAEIRFEDADQADCTLWFAAPGPYADGLVLQPDPFVLAALPAALAVGERRVRVEGSLDTVMARGLDEAMSLLSAWNPGVHRVTLEATQGHEARSAATGRRHGMFFSGGVDAMAALREDLLDLPRDHPSAVKVALLVFGLNTHDHLADGTPDPERVRVYEWHARRLRAFLAPLGVDLVAVGTNARTLYPTWQDFYRVGFGGVMGGIAATFAGSLSDVWLASDGVGWDPHPASSHPLIEPLFRSSQVSIRVANPTRPRLDKVRLLGDWPAGLRNLRTCLHHETQDVGTMNCGHCEKCVRTMLELEAVGALERAGSFDPRRLTSEAVRDIPMDFVRRPYYGEDLQRALLLRGRDDLVRAVRKRIARYEKRQRRERRRALRG
jgi:hypothetical protein